MSEGASSSEQDAGQVVTLDFSAPTRFTAEIRHRIALALEPFREALAGWLASELKADVQLGVPEGSQHTWAAAKAMLPADSVAVAVHEAESGRDMLLSVELPLILQALECMLGGEAAQAPSDRRLTDIDWALARGLLEGVVRELSQAWGELGGQELSCGEVDVEGDAGVLPAPDEPTLVLAISSDVGGASSGMSLLMPWSAFEPISDHAHEVHPHGETIDAPGALALRRGLSAAHVLVRAEVGDAQMPIERMLEIVPGKLVPLAEHAEDGVRLFAEEVALGRGTPGRSGTRRAIKVQSAAEKPVRAETYARLGRAELDRARAHAQGEGDGTEGRPMLRNIFVRVWAELGRTHISLGTALELAPGAVVELDQDAQAPVELFANGLCFASGSLVVTGEGEWGVQVDRLI